MAIAIIKNTLDDNGNAFPVLEGPRRRSMACKTISEHKMETKSLYAFKSLEAKWKMSKTDQYPHLMCYMHGFSRTFCPSDWAITMCNYCNELHLMEL